MTYGKLFHTDRYLFGPALNEAYYLESRVAVYPRVILSEKMIEIGKTYHAKHHDSYREKEFIKQLISLDADGMYYVDYFDVMGELDDPEYDYPYYLSKLRELIKKGLDNSNPNIKVKYQWMAQKYNRIIANIKKNLEEIELDPDIKELYYNLKILI
jgi:hypothetical protein